MKKVLLILIILFIYISGNAQNNSENTTDWNNSVINDGIIQPELKIFPNPCTGQKVTVQLNGEELSEIRLTNITGKVVFIKNYDIPVSKVKLLLEELPDGIYLVQVKSIQNKIFVKKLLISGN